MVGVDDSFPFGAKGLFLSIFPGLLLLVSGRVGATCWFVASILPFPKIVFPVFFHFRKNQRPHSKPMFFFLGLDLQVSWCMFAEH